MRVDMQDPCFPRRYVDLRIIPVLALVYSFSLIDRINLGAAYTAGMGVDLVCLSTILLFNLNASPFPAPLDRKSIQHRQLYVLCAIHSSVRNYYLVCSPN
jgi:hypothetical protein